MADVSPPVGGLPLSRRALLGGLLGGAAGLAGCGVLGPSGTTTAPAAAPTVRSLLDDRPFYVAHRGGGGDWPEMTGYAYEQASRLPGLKALEVSVCLSADGVLVCSHDPTTTRVTGTPYTIADETWQTLSTLRVRPIGTTDPGQPAQPLTRFDDVVDAYADRFVLFAEAKVPAAEAPLMARLAGLGQPERVVWKQYVNGPRFGEAKRYGFGTWGYVLDQPSHLGANLTRLAAHPDIDLLGAPASGTDALVAEVVAAATSNGKATMMWPITSAAGRDRALGLGCQGLMTSTIAELLPTS